MKNNVCITITGEAGCGKSSIAYKIKQLFEELGADVFLADDNGNPFQNDVNELLAETVDKRIEAIVNKGLQLNINTFTAKRDEDRVRSRNVLILDKNEACLHLDDIPSKSDKIWATIDAVACADIVICDGKVLKNRDGVCFKECLENSNTSSANLYCQDCGKISEDVQETTCPYASEINGEIVEVVLCDQCYKNRSDDI
jgi:ABC-type dipeptide/oligopeptide/nickel transport system ATPase component